jgi:hypothetical protein
MDAGAKAADGHVTFTARRSRHTKKKKKQGKNGR